MTLGSKAVDLHLAWFPRWKSVCSSNHLRSDRESSYEQRDVQRAFLLASTTWRFFSSAACNSSYVQKARLIWLCRNSQLRIRNLQCPQLQPKDSSGPCCSLGCQCTPFGYVNWRRQQFGHLGRAPRNTQRLSPNRIFVSLPVSQRYIAQRLQMLRTQDPGFVARSPSLPSLHRSLTSPFRLAPRFLLR